jgi:choline dehydrogenase
MNPKLKWYNHPLTGLQWLLFKKGAASTNHFEAGGFACSNPSVAYPNLMFHFLPLAVRYDGSSPESRHGYQVHIGPMYSNSRGHVRIKSSNAREHPAMLFNYLSTPEDRQEWTEAVAIARKIMNQPAFSQYNGGELSPGPEIKDEKEVLEWVAKDAETAIHPCGTCKMGVGSDAVVDPKSMQVHGLDGVYVVDGSVMPYVTNGNIYAPIMMLAEKAADLIAGNTPLAEEKADYFKR